MTNLSPDHQMTCIQCKQPFEPSKGSPVGKYTVCTPRCAEALLNRVQRDYPTMRQDEAIVQLQADDKAHEQKSSS